MGKFDKKAHNQEVHRSIKKRSQKVNIVAAKDEVARSKDILKMIQGR